MKNEDAGDVKEFSMLKMIFTRLRQAIGLDAKIATSFQSSDGSEKISNMSSNINENIEEKYDVIKIRLRSGSTIFKLFTWKYYINSTGAK